MSYFSRVLAPAWQTGQRSMLNNKSDASVAETQPQEQYILGRKPLLYPCFQLNMAVPSRFSLTCYTSCGWCFFFFLNGTCQVLLVTEDRTLIISLGQGKEYSSRQVGTVRHTGSFPNSRGAKCGGKATKPDTRHILGMPDVVIFKKYMWLKIL